MRCALFPPLIWSAARACTLLIAAFAVRGVYFGRAKDDLRNALCGVLMHPVAPVRRFGALDCGFSACVGPFLSCMAACKRTQVNCEHAGVTFSSSSR